MGILRSILLGAALLTQLVSATSVAVELKPANAVSRVSIIDYYGIGGPKHRLTFRKIAEFLDAGAAANMRGDTKKYNSLIQIFSGPELESLKDPRGPLKAMRDELRALIQNEKPNGAASWKGPQLANFAAELELFYRTLSESEQRGATGSRVTTSEVNSKEITQVSAPADDRKTDLSSFMQK